ncbi:MAG: hypothetical protein K8H85_02850 [Cyclobacteriaceae bacterium]|nr:hypothetical protein [Cyclobacteriaceae bacterium]
MKKLVYFLLLLTLCVSGCRQKGTSSTSKDELIGRNKATDIEEKLFNLLKDWIQSQNEADFAKYKSFYAESFQGVKRAGTNEYMFDKNGWLQDRVKMFKKKMEVKATDIQISYGVMPYKIAFNQDWKSENFSDFGAKVLLVNQVNNELRIVKEEMLESILSNAKGDANNALNHKNFFLREGINIVINNPLDATTLIATEMKCITALENHELCVKVHNYAVDNVSIDSLNLGFINRKVFIGNVDSSQVSLGQTKEFRVVREELIDSLPGISFSPNLFQASYRWKGGNSRFAETHSVLMCDIEYDTKMRSGQWAYISDVEPIVFTKTLIIDKGLKSNYLSAIDGNKNVSITLFVAGNNEYLVSYREQTECGSTYYEDIQLWHAVDDSYIFMKDLPDLPMMILDLDRDGDLDILYEQEFTDDPSDYIQWESPYYYLHGTDTVFAGCGC